MRPLILSMALAMFPAFGLTTTAAFAESGAFIVYGVSEDDMLKMRAGPGVDYRVILGLPNGTEVRVQSCEQTGSTRWCKITLAEARGVRGYVSRAYLYEK